MQAPEDDDLADAEFLEIYRCLPKQKTYSNWYLYSFEIVLNIYIYNYNIYIIYNMLYIYEKNKDVGTRCLWRCCRTVLTKQWWLRSLVLDPLVNSGGKRILCCQERLTGCNRLKKVETCWSSSFQYLIPAGLLRDASDLYGLHLRKARKQQRDRKLPKTQAWRTYFVCLCVEREYSKVETAG